MKRLTYDFKQFDFKLIKTRVMVNAKYNTNKHTYYLFSKINVIKKIEIDVLAAVETMISVILIYDHYDPDHQTRQTLQLIIIFIKKYLQ